MKANVLVVGYGTVGKRIADAVAAQDDMQVSGVVDVGGSDLLRIAESRNISIYGSTQKARSAMIKQNIEVRGTLEDAVDGSDIVVDTSPPGVPGKNLTIYARFSKPFIVNGGETHELTGFSFNALANYSRAVNRKKVRVVSCNTTALCRILAACSSIGDVESLHATIVRRGGDPAKTSQGPINAIVPVLGGSSHHAADVKTLIPKVEISSTAVKVPVTLSHVHTLQATFAHAISKEEILDAMRATPRIVTVDGNRGITSNAHIHELFRDRLRPRGDFWEVAVWEDSIEVTNKTVTMVYCVHMECIAVPENVDAIAAMLSLRRNGAQSMRDTDRALGCFQSDADYGTKVTQSLLD